MRLGRLDVLKPAAERGRVLEWLWLGLVLVGVTSPAFLVDLPALADYPNNLARMYILDQTTRQHEHHFYEASRSLLPTLGLDLLVPLVSPLIGVAAATKLFFVLSEILIITGAAAIEVAWKGRHELSGYVAAALIYSAPFAIGLMNFELALGVALWGIASWTALRHRPVVQAAVHWLAVVVLSVGHFLALGLYCATLFFYELHRFSVARDPRQAVGIAAILLVPVGGTAAILISSGGGIGFTQNEWILAGKLLWLFCSVNGYSFVWSAATVAIVSALLLLMRLRGDARLSAQGQWIGTGLLILFLILPARLFGSFYADGRILIGALMVLPSFLLLRSNTVTRLIAPMLGLAALANAVFVGNLWLSYQADYREMVSSFSHLKPGSKVLVARTDGLTMAGLAGDPFRHAPTLAVHVAEALVPSFFAIPGAQPVRLREAYREYELNDSGLYDPIPLQALTSGKNVGILPTSVARWTDYFDYLYMLGGKQPNPLPHQLDEVSVSDRFTLYRIQR